MNRYLLVASAAVLVLAGCNKPGSGAASDAAASSVAPKIDAVALAGTQPDVEAQAPATAMFIENIGVANMFEVKAAEFAAKKSKNNDVKGLAKATSRDHAKILDNLKQAIKDSGRTDLEAPTQLSEEKEAMLADLDKVPDNLFDAMYVTQQITVHGDAERLLSRYAAQGEVAQLKSFAEKTDKTIQGHLDKAHDIQTKMNK